MSSVTVNIRMEQSLKRDLERFCAEIGLSMNTLFNIYAHGGARPAYSFYPRAPTPTNCCAH